MTIYIIHNNEVERMNYLIPKVEDLIKNISPQVRSCSMEIIGPKEREKIRNPVPDTWNNRLKRARDAAILYSTLDKSIPEPNRLLRRAGIYWSKVGYMLRKSQRSLTHEQDNLRGHVACWKRIAEGRESGIVFESDVVFLEDSVNAMVCLTEWLNENSETLRTFYIDLAGGCNRNIILNHWCFKQEYGGRTIHIKGIKRGRIFLLPKLTSNTTCAYYLSKDLAQKLYKWWDSYRPMLGTDWAIMLYSVKALSREQITCIHFDPPILSHGSVNGNYLPDRYALER